MEDLAKNVLVYSERKMIAKWDGVGYALGSDPVEVKRGVALHWKGVYPEAKIRIEEVPDEVIEKRKPENPIEQNNRGQAFPGLKKDNKALKGKKGDPNNEVDKGE